jgi:hypothetical protein
MLKILKPISLIIVCSAIIHLIIFFFVSAHAGEPEAAGFSGHITAMTASAPNSTGTGRIGIGHEF